VRAESCASRGAEKYRKPFTEAGPLVSGAVITRARPDAGRRCLCEATRPSLREPREVRRPHDDGHGSAPRVEGDVLALQRELVDEHGQAEECRRLAARLSDSKKQKCERVPATLRDQTSPVGPPSFSGGTLDRIGPPHSACHRLLHSVVIASSARRHSRSKFAESGRGSGLKSCELGRAATFCTEAASPSTSIAASFRRGGARFGLQALGAAGRPADLEALRI
jgi:hypothetical protein